MNNDNESRNVEKTDFEVLLEQANKLKNDIDTAKTNLKKELLTKKLVKVQQKVYKMLLAKAMANPELLKKQDELVEGEDNAEI